MPEPTICYTIAEVMKVLGVSRPTVDKLIREGKLRRFYIGTHVRIPAADVHALVGYEPPVDQTDEDDEDVPAGSTLEALTVGGGRNES
jgi:excisionase family DNA binding protein